VIATEAVPELVAEDEPEIDLEPVIATEAVPEPGENDDERSS
jgi:hypothetical protein